MQRTIENITKAFIGESQARNLYTIFAKIAKEEGYEKVADIFLLTADNEREHAKWLARMVNKLDPECKTEVSLTANPPKIGDTITNLKTAIGGENHETESMYPEFAAIAREEGLEEIATRLEAIGNAEKHHEGRFAELLEEIENGTVLEKDEEVEWVCKKCGYLHKGKKPVDVCPSCDHPAKYFSVK